MTFFGIERTIRLGLKSLWMHRLRSALTALGIVFGVSSVIAMLAIGEGASREEQASILRLGSQNLILETVEPPKERADTGKAERMRSFGLTYKDAEAIRNTIPNVDVVVPIRELEVEARYLMHKVPVKLIGSVPWYTDIAPIRLLRGRFLSSIDLHLQQSVCVLDEHLLRDLFGFEDPIGKDVQITGNCYRVVGVVGGAALDVGQHDSADNSESVQASSAGAAAGYIYLPVTTAKARFSELDMELSAGQRKAKRIELQKITVKVGTIDQVLPTRDVLDSLLNRLHEQKDYRITVPLELLRQARRTQFIFSVVLGSIATISLLVGGIGIMNIMLATVSERTREIGIRRAMGARKRDIVVQFLSETLLLTLTGGILGIVLGLFIPFLVSRFSSMPTVITGLSLALAFGISAAVGITFGLYPAYRAANMDPIQSLRHE
jgi:putative ABC transport system permease protein